MFRRGEWRDSVPRAPSMQIWVPRAADRASLSARVGYRVSAGYRVHLSHTSRANYANTHLRREQLREVGAADERRGVGAAHQVGALGLGQPHERLCLVQLPPAHEQLRQVDLRRQRAEVARPERRRRTRHRLAPEGLGLVEGAVLLQQRRERAGRIDCLRVRPAVQRPLLDHDVRVEHPRDVGLAGGAPALGEGADERNGVDAAAEVAHAAAGDGGQ
eukprot:2447531-Prymnesium_polylepis.1